MIISISKVYFKNIDFKFLSKTYKEYILSKATPLI